MKWLILTYELLKWPFIIAISLIILVLFVGILVYKFAYKGNQDKFFEMICRLLSCPEDDHGGHNCI